MSTSLQNIKSNYAQILILIIGILIIISWIFLIVPDMKNDFSAFEELKEYVGKDAQVNAIGEKLPIPIALKSFVEYKIVNKDGNILEIKSTYTNYNQISSEKIYENTNTYFVDQTTRKHVGSEDWYFIFPFNVQKQNYLLIDPNMEVPATFVFEETKYIDDLEVYVFSCETFADDLSDGFVQFAPTKIYADQTCKTSIEPITGKTVQFTIAWDVYAIQDGSHVTIDVGGGETTIFTEHMLLQTAKEAKQVFSIYDSVIPTFMLLTLGAVFSTSVYNKKSKEKGKIIKKQFEELKQADKTKTLFLNNLTHELKTPLVPIQGNLEMLKNPKMGELNEMQKESIDEIYEHSTHLLNTVENFIKLQRIIEGKSELHIQKINLDELKELISKDFLIDDKKKINLKISFNNKLSVNADKTALIDIIAELIKNTTDFLSEDGKVEISAIEQDKNILFSVKDNGTGIPKEKQKEIFKPFIKADMSQSRTHSGVGLGLAICKGLIEGMKGKMWVESEEGKGATFFFTIPKVN